MAQDPLLPLIERFLTDTGMGASYFGQRAVRNSKLVHRLRLGRPIQSDTETRLRAFMSEEMSKRKAAARRLLRRNERPESEATLPQVGTLSGA